MLARFRSCCSWLAPLAALLVLVGGCEGEPRAKKRTKATATVKPRETLGKTTQDIKALEPEVQQGGQVASGKITSKDPITLTGNAYVSSVGRLAVDQIQHALDLYHAENDRYPADLQEFMDQIIKPNGIRLPQLPAYQEFAYDAPNHKLVVMEYPDRREALRQQFQEKVSP
jgi:hypothetical protein